MPYNPNQPRIPAGSAVGGEWADDPVYIAARKAAGLEQSQSISELNRNSADKIKATLQKNGIPIKEVVYTRSTTIVKLFGQKNASLVSNILSQSGWTNVKIKDDSPTIFGTEKDYRVFAFNPGVK